MGSRVNPSMTTRFPPIRRAHLPRGSGLGGVSIANICSESRLWTVVPSKKV
jgi:hypothetical protein